MNLLIESTHPSKDYELLDSGEGEKLERYGKYTFRRPDPQALWAKNLALKQWNEAHFSFRRDGKKGDWIVAPGVEERWQMEFADLKFWIRPTAFKHTGLFPEQASNWNWMREKVKSEKLKVKSGEVKVLNLFGYTGGATLACAQAGASVVHVDGSKVAIGWGKDNAALSGLSEKPIRWILDDAREFVRREIKRGNKYDGILLDPPAFGHGPNKELWKIEEHLPELLKMCGEILSDTPLFFLINGYASGYSAIAYENNLTPMLSNFGGVFEKGELTLEESQTKRLLPCGIFARWSNV
jgi:23S rRNA (cytosine1962-C5)-methyltransferase